jgi:hypothetical protein
VRFNWEKSIKKEKGGSQAQRCNVPAGAPPPPPPQRKLHLMCKWIDGVIKVQTSDCFPFHFVDAMAVLSPL